MSKIQKALGMLRNSIEANSSQQQVQVPARRDRDAAETAHQEGHPRGRHRPKIRVRTPYVPEGSAADEKLPDFSISIAPETLHEQGLQPQDADVNFIAQQFRRIKRPILRTAFETGNPEDGNANVIMLASALPKSGKTFCSFNLATSIARERDLGAVLVDADVLKPSISRAFGLDDRVGLIDHLLDPSVTIDDILVATDLHGIIVVPAGQEHQEATELLASQRMKKFVATLSERFHARVIVVDTPPLLLTNEAHVLAEHMGQIVLVIEAGLSTQESVTQALDSLNRTKPINAILNKARGISFAEYGGGGYGYYSAPQ